MTGLLAASVLVGLASYRVWRIIALDQITEPFRAPLLTRTDQGWARWLMDGITCAFCLGWWINVAVGFAVALWMDWNAAECALVWFASSTVTGILARGDE